MMPENKEIPNRDGYVTFYLGNKKIIHNPKLTIKNAMIDEAVKSPKHYKLPGLNIESIDVLRSVLTPEEFKGFCRGNALKYLIRAGKKIVNYKISRKPAYILAGVLIRSRIKKNKGGCLYALNGKRPF